MYNSSDGKFVRFDDVEKLFKQFNDNDLKTALRVYTKYKEESPQKNDIDPAYYFEKWIKQQLKSGNNETL